MRSKINHISHRLGIDYPLISLPQNPPDEQNQLPLAGPGKGLAIGFRAPAWRGSDGAEDVSCEATEFVPKLVPKGMVVQVNGLEVWELI